MVRGSSFAAALLLASPAWAAERTATLHVENMSCAACPIAVRTAIQGVVGVRNVNVDFAKKTAVVIFDDAKATIELLAEASRRAGFPATRKE